MRKRIICKNCFNSFIRDLGYSKKYCSSDCFDKKKIEQINNPTEIIKVKKPKRILRKIKNKSSYEFYNSPEWLDLRYKILKKYGRKCMLCNDTEAIIHVDHIKPRSKHPNLELDENNLQVLCHDCNMGKSNKDDTDFRPA